MNVKMRKLSLYDIWFLIPFCIWLFTTLLSTSFFNVYLEGYYYPRIMFGCAFILFIRELFVLNHTNEKEILGSVLMMFMMYCMFRFQRDTMMITLFVIYCMRNTDFKKVAAAAFFVLIVGFGLIIVGAQFGLIQDYIEISTSRTRHYMGFRYSLFGPAVYFNIVALFLYLRKNRIHFLTICLLFVGNYLLFQLTNSRLSFLLTTLLLFCSVFVKLLHGYIVENKWIYRLGMLSLILCLIFSFAITVNYSVDNLVLVKLNSILGKRLQYGKDAIDMIGFNWLGKSVNYVGNGLDSFGNKDTGTYNYVDNFYIHYLQVYGILFMGLVLSLVTAVQVRCKKTKDIYLAMILMVFAIHGIVDDLMFTMHYNMFFVTCTYLMSGENKNSLFLQGLKVILLLVMAYFMVMRYTVVI